MTPSSLLFSIYNYRFSLVLFVLKELYGSIPIIKPEDVKDYDLPFIKNIISFFVAANSNRPRYSGTARIDGKYIDFTID